MQTEIFYFSGTGNSLAVARDISEKLEGTLTPAGSATGKTVIETNADRIGIIFPVYFASLGGSGLPGVIEDLIQKLIIPTSAYVFAIATHRGGPFSTMGNLDAMLRQKGAKLDAGFTVQLSTPFSAHDKLMNVLFGKQLTFDEEKENREMNRLAQEWRNKKTLITEYIQAGNTGYLETTGPVKRFLLKPWMAVQYRMGQARYRLLAGMDSLPFEKTVRFADSGFKVTSGCIGCGTCVKVCPVQNIKLVDGKPLWLHGCESCYACFQWCPQAAIAGEMPKYEKKYHHPSVRLPDMLR